MTYLEALILIAWMQYVPRILDDQFSFCLYETRMWIVGCLGDDRVQDRFVSGMEAAFRNVEEFRRRREG